MNASTTRWTTAIAAVALIVLPGSVLAQSNPQQKPPSQPPTQSQPPAQSQPPPASPAQPAQPPAAQTQPAAPQSATEQPAMGQADAAAAKQHLSEARGALSQLTSMPEAARLQGDARTQVSELISNFNALITTQNNWRAAYAKVDENLKTLLGPDPDQGATASAAAGTTGTTGTATAGTTGTTGTAGAAGAASAGSPAMQLDPAIRAKLVEFRTHLKAFEKAASGAMPPSAPTDVMSNPANPGAAASAAGSEPAKPNPPSAAPPSAASPTAPPSASATGTTGTASTTEQNVNAAAQQEFAAIDAILAKSNTGALTKAQTAELRRHLDALRALLK